MSGVNDRRDIKSDEIWERAKCEGEVIKKVLHSSGKIKEGLHSTLTGIMAIRGWKEARPIILPRRARNTAH